MTAGTLGIWFETGSEGVMWVLEEEGKTDLYNEMFIDAGDHLRIIAPDGSVAWEGVIVPDFEAGYQPYPMNPSAGQPCALGFWIHWTQQGFEPDTWAAFFVRQTREAPAYRGELTKRAKPPRQHICAACNRRIDEEPRWVEEGVMRYPFHLECLAPQVPS